MPFGDLRALRKRMSGRGFAVRKNSRLRCLCCRGAGAQRRSRRSGRRAAGAAGRGAGRHGLCRAAVDLEHPRFCRTRRSDRPRRNSRQGERLSGAGAVQRGRYRQEGRPALPDRKRLVSSRRRGGQGRVGAQQGGKDADRNPAATRPGSAGEKRRHRGRARSGAGRRSAGAGPDPGRPGQSRHRQYQSRLYRHRLADRGKSQQDQCHGRQCRRARQRHPDADRQPGSDVHQLSGQPARTVAGAVERTHGRISPASRSRSVLPTARPTSTKARSISSTSRSIARPIRCWRAPPCRIRTAP